MLLQLESWCVCPCFGPSSLKKAFTFIKTDPVTAVLTLRRVLTLRPVLIFSLSATAGWFLIHQPPRLGCNLYIVMSICGRIVNSPRPRQTGQITGNWAWRKEFPPVN